MPDQNQLRSLLERIEQAMTTHSSATPTSPRPPRDPVVAQVQDALSGALGEAILARSPTVLEAGLEAGVVVEIPVTHLKASGLRFVESAIPSRSGRSGRSLAGSASAVKNAEGRVANIVGEAFSVSALDYDADPAAPPVVAFLVVPRAATA